MTIPFLEVIESITPDPNILMWKFDDAGQEIKNGASLTVRESQCVMLLSEGKLADIFGPGQHKLSTENIPILTNIKSWKYGFNSPFKVDIYYFNTHQFVNLKWGTPAPIIMPDSQFGQVRIRAFGVYNIRISDIAKFFRQYAGTFPRLTIFELERQMRDFIAPKFGEVLAQHGYSVMDVAGNISELSAKLLPQLQPFFEDLGVELINFQISNVTLPEEVCKHFDNITNMNMTNDIDKFQKFNMAKAVEQQGTAVNDGAQTAAMMGLIMNQISQQPQQPSQSSDDDVTSKLKKLKNLFDAGLIEEEEYKTKKAELLDRL